MKAFNKKNYVKNLPDIYAKSSGSNNAKILEIARSSLEALQTDLERVYESLDIDRATGKTLDMIGAMYDQPRGLATDAQYRFLIRAKILRYLSGGDYKSVANAICMTFNCDPSQVLILEVNENPLTVALVNLPFEVIEKAGITAGQTFDIVQSLLPVCVKLVEHRFTGAFRFASDDWATTTTEGFASDDGTIKGGYLGSVERQDYFAGTFKFNNSDYIATLDGGFASDDGSIVGGYLGTLESNNDEEQLPI